MCDWRYWMLKASPWEALLQLKKHSSERIRDWTCLMPLCLCRDELRCFRKRKEWFPDQNFASARNQFLWGQYWSIIPRIVNTHIHKLEKQILASRSGATDDILNAELFTRTERWRFERCWFLSYPHCVNDCQHVHQQSTFQHPPISDCASIHIRTWRFLSAAFSFGWIQQSQKRLVWLDRQWSSAKSRLPLSLRHIVSLNYFHVH